MRPPGYQASVKKAVGAEMRGKKVWKEGKRIVREEGENRGNPCLQDYAAEIRTFDFRGRVFRKAIEFLKSDQRWRLSHEANSWLS